MNFDIDDFLPYLLNRAAEKSSLGFQQEYKSKYGMLVTEWRVLFHLGHYGDMTAIDICKKGDLHKTKVSRAVTGLQKKRFLERETMRDDKRFEVLSLTSKGRLVFEDLISKARDYNATLTAPFTQSETDFLFKALRRIKQNS
jgi:DNA-binding MarR family transcriptional regulator